MALNLDNMLSYARSVVGTSYTWGGGHGGWLSTDAARQAGLDCSGFVSQVLHAGGVNLPGPQTTTGLASNLVPGQGPVTVYDKTSGTPSQQHTIINILGNWFESGGNPADNPSGGVSQLTSAQAKGELAGGGFTPYHPSGTGSLSSLSGLWVNAGGSPSVANIMAAIAMAESHGVVGAQHKNQDGSVDNGLWQINNKAHPQFNPQRLRTDPNYNASAAVAVFKSQGLNAWTTYTSGAYRQYLNTAARTTISYGGPTGGRVRPGGAAPSTSDPSAVFTAYTALQDTPRKQTSENVSFNPLNPVNMLDPFGLWLGEAKIGWHALRSAITAPFDSLETEVEHLLGEAALAVLRAVEFVTGITLLGIGIYLTAKPTGRRSTNSAPARAVRTLIGYTPVGSKMRIARATRAGRREGQEEHYRLQARRAARSAEAKKTGEPASAPTPKESIAEGQRIQKRGLTRYGSKPKTT